MKNKKAVWEHSTRNHKCWNCGKEIPAGSPYWRFVFEHYPHIVWCGKCKLPNSNKKF